LAIFLPAQNQGLRTEYTADMLPKTLDLVNRTYHFNLNCDWTEDEIQAVADTIRELCAQV